MTNKEPKPLPDPEVRADKLTFPRALLCIQHQGTAWLGPTRAHLHCSPWEGGVPGQPNLCRQRSIVESGAVERMHESNKNSDNWSQTPRVSKARLMLGPHGDGAETLPWSWGTQLSFPWSHPPPQFWGRGRGRWAEKERDKQENPAGQGGRWLGVRSHPGPETRLARGTESNLKVLPRLFLALIPTPVTLESFH